MKYFSVISSAVAGVALLAGCRTNPADGFGDIQKTVRDRAGQNVVWPLTQSDDDKADAAVAGLLRTNLTADSAVQIALLNNRALRATFEDIGISRADVAQAGLPPNPRFGAYIPIDSPPRAVDTQFSLTEDFLNLLLLPLRKKIAADQFEQTKLRVADGILQVIAQVKTAFYTVQARQQLLQRLTAIRDANAAAADLAGRQFDAGNVNELSLANQQGALQQARLECTRAQAQLSLDRDHLNRLLGLWGVNANWVIDTELPPIPAAEISSDNLETFALAQRLDLAAAQREVALLQRALSFRANTRYLPATINLGVETDRASRQETLIGPSLDLDLPIFDHGQAAVPRLQAQYRRARWRSEALAAGIHSDVRQAWDSLTAARDLADFYQKTYLPERARIFQQTLLQYNAMQQGAFALLAAREQQLNVEREYIESWRDYWIARVDLERALGGKLPEPDSQLNTAQKIQP